VKAQPLGHLLLPCPLLLLLLLLMLMQCFLCVIFPAFWRNLQRISEGKARCLGWQ
jgi:hypothetical protein